MPGQDQSSSLAMLLSTLTTFFLPSYCCLLEPDAITSHPLPAGAYTCQVTLLLRNFQTLPTSYRTNLQLLHLAPMGRPNQHSSGHFGSSHTVQCHELFRTGTMSVRNRFSINVCWISSANITCFRQKIHVGISTLPLL